MSDAAPAAAEALLGRARALLGAGRPAEAAPLLKEIIQRLDDAPPADALTRADVRRLLGNALRESGDLEASTAAFEDAIRISKATVAPPAWNIVGATALAMVARNYSDAGRADK